jgi:hypothetical protein
MKLLPRVTAWVISLGFVLIIAITGFKMIEHFYKPLFRSYLEYTLSPLNPVKNFISGFPLTKGNSIRLLVSPEGNEMAGVRLRFVTWGDRQKDYQCNWELSGIDLQGNKLPISRSGHFRSGEIQDWQLFAITFVPIKCPDTMTFELLISSEVALDSCYVGIPVYECDSTNRTTFSFTCKSIPPLQPDLCYEIQHQLMYRKRPVNRMPS